MSAEIKEDTKKFIEMWEGLSLFEKIVLFPFKSTLREGFQIGFTYGVEWTIDNIEREFNCCIKPKVN